jgi:type II secretory pathway pseudopilin PulG
MFNKLFKTKPGQTLVELMVAIALIAMVVTALLVLVSAATKVGLSSLRRSQATKLATLALESVRYYRDKDQYYTIPNPDEEVCFTIPDQNSAPGLQVLGTVPCSDNMASSAFQSVEYDTFNYIRRIKMMPEDPDTNSRDVIVEIRWYESTGTAVNNGLFTNNYRQVILSSTISQW